MNDILSDIHGRVGERVRAELVRNGASDALRDPAIFEEVDAVLRAAIDRSKPSALLLPELLGDPATWRLETALKYQSHRGGAGGAIIFVAVVGKAVFDARTEGRSEFTPAPDLPLI